MKFRRDSVWTFWQTPALRAFVKRHSRIKTPQQALKAKELRAILYFFCTLGTFNYFFYNEIKRVTKFENPEDEAMRIAMLQGFQEGKVVKLDAFSVKEIRDFDRDDHENLVEDAPFRTTL